MSSPPNVHLVLQPKRNGVSFEEHRPRMSFSDESKSPTMHSAPITPTSQHPIEDVKFRSVKHADVFQATTILYMSRQEVEQHAWAEVTIFFDTPSVIASLHLMSTSIDFTFSSWSQMISGLSMSF